MPERTPEEQKVHRRMIARLLEDGPDDPSLGAKEALQMIKDTHPRDMAAALAIAEETWDDRNANANVAVLIDAFYRGVSRFPTANAKIHWGRLASATAFCQDASKVMQMLCKDGLMLALCQEIADDAGGTTYERELMLLSPLLIVFHEAYGELIRYVDCDVSSFLFEAIKGRLWEETEKLEVCAGAPGEYALELSCLADQELLDGRAGPVDWDLEE
jgi:hypothetical protein